jgi:hypothetical protein
LKAFGVAGRGALSACPAAYSLARFSAARTDIDYLVRELDPCRLFRDRQHGTRVAGGELRGVDQLLDLLGQIEQPQGIRYRRARLGHLVGKLGLCHLVLGE